MADARQRISTRLSHGILSVAWLSTSCASRGQRPPKSFQIPILAPNAPGQAIHGMSPIPPTRSKASPFTRAREIFMANLDSPHLTVRPSINRGDTDNSEDILCLEPLTRPSSHENCHRRHSALIGRSEIVEVRSEVNCLRADVASDLFDYRKAPRRSDRRPTSGRDGIPLFRDQAARCLPSLRSTSAARQHTTSTFGASNSISIFRRTTSTNSVEI
jgi:hypothetical protein